MYLKSLTLKGFKSFANPTTFAFEPGVTCVVGPNGSGKSNVVDGLAWVMGEQGAKTLRGGKMDDVIFAGTSTRGPLGRAEVTLTIDNSDGALPIEYSEVTISRILFRNGASEYSINGEQCRLLDVQELLSDSGLGREMHVIVGQGRLDNVLQASPEERRGFIEEAAGILKHRRRKEKTVRKLEAMEANLTRLSDLAGEVRRQLKPLGAQAEIAREAQSIQAEVRDARARLLADDVVTLRVALDAHNRSEAERHTERLVLQEQLERTSLRVRHLESEMSFTGVESARATVFALESVQERLRGLYTLANQRLALLGNDGEMTPLGSGVTTAMIEAATHEVAVLQDTITTTESAWRVSQQLTLEIRAELDAIDEHVAAQSALVSQFDLDLAQARGKAESALSTVTAVEGERARQQDALNAAHDRRASAEAALASLKDESSRVDDDQSGVNRAYEEANEAVTASEMATEKLRDELHSLERERDALHARVGALSMALDQKDGSSALVAAKLAGVRGLVAEYVQVRPGYEAAVAAALGSVADAVLAENLDSAVAALDQAHESEFGRVDIIVADARGASVETPTAPGVVPAVSVVDAPDGLKALLRDTVIADDLASARAAWKSVYATLDRDITLITKTGDVLTRYLLRGGSGAKRSRIELVADRDAAQARLDEVGVLSDAARFALAEQRAENEAAKSRQATALANLREFDAQLAARSEAHNRARVQAEAAQAECDRLEAGIAQTDEKLTSSRADHEQATHELARLRERERPLLDVSTRDAVFVKLETQREAEVQARLDLETARERVRAEELRVEGLRAQLDADRQAAEESARRIVIRRRQIDKAQAVADDIPPVLASLDRSVAEARVVFAQAESDRRSANSELTQLRQDEATLRERLHGITENVHGLELQIYEKKLHLSTLLERAAGELGLIEEVLVAEYGPEVPIPVTQEGEDGLVPFVRAEQQLRLEKAERKLNQLGRVNPLALEEFAALEQRHTFLTEQLTDLHNTKKDLLSIIDDVDATMQSVFESAFEDTRAAFERVLPILFPGGTGYLALTNPDDLLTTGIEVSVKPAGKKIERLSLLSGGERSLAAVCLLIAIFKARPSPFYIMDEVEAALDDANLGRLLTIFEDLRESSQLIVITHQKRTMEIADALYGVSMRQDGVSAVVGQRVANEQAAAQTPEKVSA